MQLHYRIKKLTYNITKLIEHCMTNIGLSFACKMCFIQCMRGNNTWSYLFKQAHLQRKELQCTLHHSKRCPKMYLETHLGRLIAFTENVARGRRTIQFVVPGHEQRRMYKA